MTFQVGRMTSASTNLIKITVRPQLGGVLTNYVGMVLNEADGKEDNVGLILTRVEGGPRLTIGRLGSGQYELQLEGEAGRTYRIQSSADLSRWVELMNVPGPFGTMALPEIGAASSVSRFYRAVSP